MPAVPIVYNYIHIGNARSSGSLDTIRRYFQYRGYRIMPQLTDVDDKLSRQSDYRRFNS